MKKMTMSLLVLFLVFFTSCKVKETEWLSMVEILNSSKGINGIDICEINGQVKNTGDETVDSVTITVTLYKGNLVLETNSDHIITGINFEPGQVADFNLWFEEIDNWDDVDQIKYDLTWAKCSRENASTGYS